MDEASYAEQLARQKPDLASALYAMDLALEMLQSAKEKLSKEDYRGAFDASKNAVRLASSAVMFRDGYVSDNLESTAAYLLQKYPGDFPVEEWHKLEEMTIEGGYGLYYMIMKAMGKVKKAGEAEAIEAFEVANHFIQSALGEIHI